MSKALEDVAAERERQVAEENWTSEHDDEHLPGTLAAAGACYALEAADVGQTYQQVAYDMDVPAHWPWAPHWWKTTEKRRDLVKAAALIIAEIERLDRADTEEAGVN